MTGETYELKTGVSLLDLLRNRPRPLPRRRDRTIVWPRRPVGVPGIPFGPYDAAVRRTFRHADAANKRVEDYRNSLNAQRK